MADLSTPYGRALHALALLAVDPTGLGGLHLRARSGPVRDAFVAHFNSLLLPLRRLHPQISDDALFGGLDLDQTLTTGRMVTTKGLVYSPSALLLSMAERATLHLSARLSQTLDASTGHCLIALDEGADDDETLHASLADRLAFHIDLNDVALGDITAMTPHTKQVPLANVTTPDSTITDLLHLTTQLGIDSARAPQFALRAARANAALSGRDRVTPEDIEVACALTLAHRATQWPQETPDQEPQPPEPQDAPSETKSETLDLPDELVLAAVRALLPDDLLDRVAATKQRSAKGAGAGAKKQGNRRGRPLPARAGRLDGTARVDIAATLRAAAPWQTIRAQSRPDHRGLHIRPGDIHLRRYETRSDRLLIFTVDASGSAALARLAEAKGAIELMLAQAYAQRDHVALIAFRGTDAELLLPPTRSLVQTKRRLSALPGGGGTPLAAGLQQAMVQADHAVRRGLTPTIVLLTDGKANIALNGSANRAEAQADARLIARQLSAAGAACVTIDTGQRPNPALRDLAAVLGSPCIAMPRADAQRLSATVGAALET